MVSSNGYTEEEGRKGEELVVEEEADTGLPQDETDCCYRTLTSQRCCAAWPRTCACCLGVVLPLWLLIFLSLCFGVALASFEADAEIEANDQILQDRVLATALTKLTLDFARLMPRICLAAFVLRNETTYQNLVEEYIETQDVSAFNSEYSGYVERQVQESPVLITNWTDFNEFMAECGDHTRLRMDGLVENLTDAAGAAAQDMSFNWVRCYEGARGLHGSTSFRDSLGPHNQSIDTTFAAQEEIYSKTWWSDFEQLSAEYATASYNLDGTLTLQDISGVYQQALSSASGNSTCNLNGPGSAFFWFTVLSTMGYGNQAPESTGGQAMVFTLGFLSIVMFGAILSVSGYIVAAIVNDGFSRIPIINRYCGPKLDVLLWAMLTYTWMLVISTVTQDWKERRLQESLGGGDGYWFAYISTTTIGLGDIFLEPEVFRGQDLLTFPLLFLTGFVFFSAFLGKLAEVMRRPEGSKTKSLFDALETLLKRPDESETPEHHEEEPAPKENDVVGKVEGEDSSRSS